MYVALEIDARIRIRDFYPGNVTVAGEEVSRRPRANNANPPARNSYRSEDEMLVIFSVQLPAQEEFRILARSSTSQPGYTDRCENETLPAPREAEFSGGRWGGRGSKKRTIMNTFVRRSDFVGGGGAGVNRR